MVKKVRNVEKRRVLKQFDRLIAADKLLFPRSGLKIEAPTQQGVYVIYSRSGKVVHVGRTYRGRKGLLQRLRNHLQGKSSFVIKYFDGDGSRLRRGYSYQCIKLGKGRERLRALLEAYATGKLCPAHIGTGAAIPVKLTGRDS